MGWTLSDDLDGSPATKQTFGFDGQVYEIDLGVANREKLEKALRPFLAVARVYGEMPEAPVDFPGTEAVVVPAPTPAPRTPTRKAAARPEKKPKRKLTSVPTQKPDFAAVRVWANENGYSVGPTGRLPAAILEAYATQTSAL